MTLATPARLAAALDGYLPGPGAWVGLLGGSFNPAHDGHFQISREAIKRLGLDQVWWLVSPQNPLKATQGMARLEERLASARMVSAADSRIRPSILETTLGTRYTVDTLVALKQRFPRVSFVWLMGADNLVQISSWQNWTLIFNSLAIAVCDRPTYSLKANASVAARRFARCRVRERAARSLATRTLPAWVFLHVPLHGASATAIRHARGGASV